MKKRKLRKKKTMIMHLLCILTYTVLMYFLLPIYELLEYPPLGIRAFEVWTKPFYAVECLIVALLVYFIVLYFTEIKPRTFYYCFDIVLISFVTLIAFFGMVVGLVSIPIEEAVYLQIFHIVLLILLFLFVIYTTWHRGLAIYRDKIRIFNFRIKTYPTTTVDDITIKHGRFFSAIDITICGDTTTFRLSTISAKICEKRLKTVVTTKKEPTL